MHQSHIDFDDCLLSLSDEDSNRSNWSRQWLREIPRDAYSIIAEVRAKPGKRRGAARRHSTLTFLVRGDSKNLVDFF